MIHNSKCQPSPMSLWLPLILVSIVLALLMPGIAGATMTKTFPYNKDVTLESQSSNYNYGSNPTCFVDGTGGSSGERSTLMRWNISTLPKKSYITKATIYLQVNDPSRDTFYVYGLKKEWLYYEATWRKASDDLYWNSGGASGVYDRDAYSSGTLYAQKTGTAKIELDPELPEAWLVYPQNNFGVVIASKNRTSSDRIGFYCSEAAQSTLHPKLVIEYR